MWDKLIAGQRCCGGRYVFVLSVGLATVSAWQNARATEEYDPFEAQPAVQDPFEQHSTAPIATPRDEAHPPGSIETIGARQARFQDPAADAPAEVSPPPADAPGSDAQRAVAQDPCAAAVEKPLFELGIGISLPTGRLPTDHAAACWESLNATTGPLAGSRIWSNFDYQWDATCLYHRPLYFEEINLERYGYGCHPCLQPAASAAHFFGTVPALPYLMAVDCPHECVYTLGHYRPGSCPPWRHHWPPCDGLAAAAQAGVLTGMIFLIP
jgi:hypothetical protein